MRAKNCSSTENIWPLAHPDNDSIIEISAALIKKQGDYPEFWINNHSFIGAMELFCSILIPERKTTRIYCSPPTPCNYLSGSCKPAGLSGSLKNSVADIFKLLIYPRLKTRQ
jgi:hypothetical protein